MVIVVVGFIEESVIVVVAAGGDDCRSMQIRQFRTYIKQILDMQGRQLCSEHLLNCSRTLREEAWCVVLPCFFLAGVRPVVSLGAETRLF
jgi:hypothetical protein